MHLSTQPACLDEPVFLGAEVCGTMPREGTAMQTITLSEAAVATLHFEIKGWKGRVREIDLPGYRELVAAGIMEPDGEKFRLTEWGRVHGQEVVEQEYDRIERERYEPPDASGLSETAWQLLQRVASGDRIEVTPENRPAFRELAAARIILLGSSFARGPESVYHWTYWGWHRRQELLECAKAAG